MKVIVDRCLGDPKAHCPRRKHTHTDRDTDRSLKPTPESPKLHTNLTPCRIRLLHSLESEV